MDRKTLIMMGMALAAALQAAPSLTVGAPAAGGPVCGPARDTELIFLLGKTAEEAGLPDAGCSEITGTVFGRPARGSADLEEKDGRRVVSGLYLSADIAYDDCFAALKDLYDVPFASELLPYVAPYGAGVTASFFTGSGTVSIQQNMNSPACVVRVSSAVPDAAKIPVLQVAPGELDAHMGMDLAFGEDRFKNARFARILHGDDPVWRVKYADAEGNEFRVYMQKRQTNVVPAQFDPDVTWKLEWEHFDIKGDPLDATGRNLTCWEYDDGGMGCVSWYNEDGNFAVLMTGGAARDTLTKAMGEVRAVILKAKLKRALRQAAE